MRRFRTDGAGRDPVSWAAIVAAILIHATFGSASVDASVEASADEILTVWIRADGSRFAEAFASDHLPPLRALAEEMGAEFRVIDVTDGAPADIVSTPLVSFVNGRGRSIYQGRYTSLDRLRTFIRTMRFVPQGDAPLVRTDVLMFPYERVKLVTPLKITKLAGARPPDHDDAAFEEEVRDGFARGLRRLAEAARVEVGRGDRLFYFDVHPWLSEEKELYLSAAVFSHFNCKEPILTTYDDPHHAPWSDREALYAQVGNNLEHELERSFGNVAGGDAFRPVPRDAQIVSWSDLGLEIEPESESEAEASSVGGFEFDEIGNWHVVDPPAGSAPAIQFRFPAPLDNWVGVAPLVSGRVKMGAGGLVAGATGWVEVDLTSVEMGEPELDDALQGSAFLHTEEHRHARFRLNEMSAPADPLTAGRQVLGEAGGTFELKGVTVPLSLPLLVEPVVVTFGEPRLLVSGRFTIELDEPFGIQRAEGPPPANNTLIFDLALVLAPSTPISSP